MIIDELIKSFKDKNITVNKKREDVFQQDCKETYVSKKEKEKEVIRRKNNESVCNV